MSISSDYSLSDIAAVTGSDNSKGNGLFGNDGALWLIVLFLFIFAGGWGNRGFGGGSGGGVTDGYVLTSDFANIERKLDGVNNGLCDGFYTQAQLIAGVNQNMATGFANAELSRANQQAALMAQLNNMAMTNMQCCCENKAAIADVKYTIATGDSGTQRVIENGTRDVLENQNANARAILDAINAQAVAAKDAKIAEQNQQIFALQLAASQSAQNMELINTLRPCPIPSYQTCNPWASNGTAYNGCNCM